MCRRAAGLVYRSIRALYPSGGKKTCGFVIDSMQDCSQPAKAFTRTVDKVYAEACDEDPEDET